MRKQINLQSILALAGLLLLAIIVVFFIYHLIGSFSTVIGTIIALGAISFFGWFFIEHTH